MNRKLRDTRVDVLGAGDIYRTSYDRPQEFYEPSKMAVDKTLSQTYNQTKPQITSSIVQPIRSGLQQTYSSGQEDYGGSIKTPTNPISTIPTNNPPNSITDIYNRQIKFANQQYTQQQALAQRYAEQERTRLQDQLQAQREDLLRGQQAAVQGGFQRGRNMVNNLANRGLATSGLLQLGDVQNRMAQGASLANLANADTQVKKAGINASQDITNSLQDQIAKATMQRDSSLLNADMQQYEMAKGEQDKSLQTLLSLIEVFGAEGMDDDTKGLIGQAYEAYLDGDTNALRNLISSGKVDGDNPNTGGSLLDSLKTTDERGNQTFKNSFDITKIFDYMKVGAGLGDGQIVTLKTQDGKKLKYNSYEEAINYLNDMYKDFPNKDKISIVQKENKFKFKVDNQVFDTYNQANDYIKSMKK